jgi:hypothetical protein
MKYGGRIATGLQPGLCFQIGASLEAGADTVVIDEPLFDFLLPIIRDACPNVDPYGLTLPQPHRTTGS